MLPLFTMLLDLFRAWSLVVPVTALAALALLVLVLAIRPPRASTLPKIAIAPDASFLLGHVPSMARYIRQHENASGWFAQLMDTTGLKVVQILVPGRKVPCVVLADPEQIDRISASTEYDAADPNVEIFGACVPDAMFGRKSDKMYKHHKLALAYSHSAPFLAKAGTYFASHMTLLLDEWRTAAEAGSFNDVSKDAQFLLTDVVSELAFGESFDQINTGIAHPVAKAMTTISDSFQSSLFARIHHWIARRRASFKNAYKTLDEYTAQRIEQARSKIRGGGEVAEIDCFIDIVMKKEARDGEGNVMSYGEMRDEAFSAMIAGADTSSAGFVWAFKLLSEHPEVQHKLHGLLSERLPSAEERVPTAAEVGPDATPYLEAVAQEILRVSGVATLTERQALHDTFILDSSGTRQAIPKGTIVFLLNYYTATHLTADGLEFKPERWLDEKTGQFDSARVWSRPFGSGTRGCYGFRTATVFLRLFLAQLTLAYFVRPLPANMRTDRVTQTIIRRPKTNLVGLQRWDEVEYIKEKQG